MSFFNNYSFTAKDRFLRYVAVDTQSDPESTACPSTAKQKILATMLVEELKAIGIADAVLNDQGYVYATIPSNSLKKVPVICFCSHMDTSPDCGGENVKPLIHARYDGGDIVLPDDAASVIRSEDHPDLAAQAGNDIITASGTTLLGADNKAGLAEIIDAACFLMTHPEIKHGAVRILFTPDEEIGRGVDNVDMTLLGADFGYTVDGESAGSVENETFSANAARITVRGVSTHPGFAKNKMRSAIRIAAEIVSCLPKDRLSPESTEGREGFIHPVAIKGTTEEANIDFILRDFELEGLRAQGRLLEAIAEEVMAGYPGAAYSLRITEQYRNMKQVLDQHPKVTSYAIQAVERSGLTPRLQSIRGGTDGSRLSFMGLPCPNIFAGEHAFHSKEEWISVQDMEKAVETIVHLCMIWEEESV